MNKEFHWYENVDDIHSKLEEKFLGFYNTGRAILENKSIIHSDQSYYFSTNTISKGYRLFAHFANGNIEEVKLGDNTCTNRYIRPAHCLSKMLIAGEFGELSV